MPNMSLKKNEMPVQKPDVRNKNFSEVALGYTEEQAIDEANRCLNCKNKPCVGGCPVSIDIPEFITKIRERDFEGAYKIITKSSSLPAVCGRVCPQETQCESKCVLSVSWQTGTTHTPQVRLKSLPPTVTSALLSAQAPAVLPAQATLQRWATR